MADLDVRQIRRRVGVTQADLAVMVGVTQPAASAWRPGAGNRRASPPVREFGLALATYPEAQAPRQACRRGCPPPRAAGPLRPMVGSVDEAEDLVQETFLRAPRGGAVPGLPETLRPTRPARG